MATTKWYDILNADTTTIADIQSKIQTIDYMTTEQIRDFMSRTSKLITDNLTRNGLIEFINSNGDVMRWRVNTTTDIEERLLVALEAIITSNLKADYGSKITSSLLDIVTDNFIAFIIDTFIGLPYNQTRTIQSIPVRMIRLSNNLNALWTIAPPQIANSLVEYTNKQVNEIVSSINRAVSDHLKIVIDQYINNVSDDLSKVDSVYIDDLIYRLYVAYLTNMRDTLIKAYGISGCDTSKITEYFDEILPIDIYNESSPISGKLTVTMRKHTGVLEIVDMYGGVYIRDQAIEYTYDNSAMFNRFARTLANIKYAIAQGNQNVFVLLASCINSFIDLEGVFVPRGFIFLNNRIDTFDTFVSIYPIFVSDLNQVYYQSITQYTTNETNKTLVVPNEPYTSMSDDVLRFQYEIYKRTNGYIYIYDRIVKRSTFSEYQDGLKKIDATITADSIFEFGVEAESTIANKIVNISRAVDKTALTIATVAKIGAKIISPLGIPLVYLVGLCESTLREIWWKLGWDDLSTIYPFPPPFGLVLSVLHPVYDVALIARYPVLLALKNLFISGLQLSQLISKCIRDKLIVRLLNDSNTRFLGVNFIMSPVYSSTGLIDGTQMMRVLDNKSYMRLLALQILNMRYSEYESIIMEFLNNLNSVGAPLQLDKIAKDYISSKLSPEFLKSMQNNIYADRTENYNRNVGRLSSSLRIPVNTIDLTFYDTLSVSVLKDSVIGIFRDDYDMNVEISEDDITKAIAMIQTQYVNANTFKTHIFLSNTQETEQNGYFLRGIDVTDNGLLQRIENEIDQCITQSKFMV